MLVTLSTRTGKSTFAALQSRQVLRGISIYPGDCDASEVVGHKPRRRDGVHGHFRAGGRSHRTEERGNSGNREFILGGKLSITSKGTHDCRSPGGTVGSYSVDQRTKNHSAYAELCKAR